MKIKALLFAAAAMVGISALAQVPASTKVYFDPFEANPGDKVIVKMKLDNPEQPQLSTIQCDVAYPEGMTAVQLSKAEADLGTSTAMKDGFMVPNCFLANEDFDQPFSIVFKLNPNADVDFRVAFLDANAEGKVTGAQEGAEFCIFAIQVAEDMTPGNYEISFPKTVVSGLGEGKAWGQIDPYTVSVTVKGDTPTAVTDINAKAVAGVKYYNLAGVESDQPFDGVNVVVTTYTDGTKAASKVIK